MSIAKYNISMIAKRKKFAYRHSIGSGRGDYKGAYRMAMEVFPLKHVIKK